MFPSHVKRTVSPENSSASPGVEPQFEKSPMSQSTTDQLDSPAVTPSVNSTVTPSVNSKQEGRCDSTVAPREKAPDPHVKSTGSLTLHLHMRGKWSSVSPHETRPDSPVETPEEPQNPCQHWRGSLRFQAQLEMRP